MITRLDRGGSAEAFLNLALEFKRMGHDVAIATGPSLNPQADIGDFSKTHGIPVHSLPSLRRDVNPFRDIPAFLETLRVIRTVRPDVLHTHTSKAGFIGRIAGRVAGAGAVVHTPHGHIFYGYYGRLLTGIFILLERIGARFSDRIVTLTDLEKREYIEKGIADDGRITTIPCGIFVKDFSPMGGALREELGIAPGIPLVGWVGRLDPVKGCGHFLGTCRLIKEELPDARYLVVGDGPLRREMEELSRSLGLSREVIFLGFREDIPSIMSSIDLLVHTPLNEGLGKVLLEAMASAKPIVAAKVGGIPEIVTHGLNGLLVPPGDCASGARESVKILKDRALAEKLGNEGRKRVAAFDNSWMVEKTVELYRGLLAK
ncbi:MAG TPA: glycosyltransferase family 4 protein [Dissulfurispiraceae bacterium]